MLRQAHGGRHIKKPSQADGRVDRKTQAILESLSYLALQKYVKNDIRVGKVVVEVPDRTLHLVRDIPYVCFGNRSQESPVHHISKVVKPAVYLLIGINLVRVTVRQ